MFLVYKSDSSLQITLHSVYTGRPSRRRSPRVYGLLLMATCLFNQSVITPRGTAAQILEQNTDDMQKQTTGSKTAKKGEKINMHIIHNT